MRARTATAITVGAALTLAFWACSTEEAQETLCEPGTNVFCRCVDLSAGTKRCSDDGTGFGECRSTRGSCDELPSGGGGSGGYQPPPPGELLAPCQDDDECGNGMTCPMGYCTKPCASYEECGPGDCIELASHGPLCAPYCITQGDCAAYGGKSMCGWTDVALPPADVVVCAHWGSSWGYPPDHYACTIDTVCSLGMEWLERVCHDEHCTDGCHRPSDCPPESSCSSSSPDELGQCDGAGGGDTGGSGGAGGGDTGGSGGAGGGGGADGDVCPGEPVAISLANDELELIDDTCELESDSHYDVEAPCWSGTIPAPEYVYQVVPADSGYLYVGVEPDADYDVQLYVRSACDTASSQLDCMDLGMAGEYELLDPIAVTADEPIWVFVDGYNLSCGTYILELLLSET